MRSSPDGWPDDFFDRIMKPEKSPCVENKRGELVAALVSCLNSIEIVNKNGLVNVEATKKAREKYIKENKLPRISIFYKKGFVVREDENGIPCYVKE